MTTLTVPTTASATSGRTHPTMTILTSTETASPNVMRAALIQGDTFPRHSIWHQTADNLTESRAGPGSHPLGNATGSRDAP